MARKSFGIITGVNLVLALLLAVIIAVYFNISAFSPSRGQGPTEEIGGITAEAHSITAEARSTTAEAHSTTAETHSTTAETHSTTAEAHSTTAEAHSTAALSPAAASLTKTPDSAVLVPASGLNSPNAILVRLKDNTILMQKHSEQRIYPASLTKIMTALVVIEELPDLQREVELPDAIFRELNKADASMAGFVPGEKVRAIDLLYGMMLPSGAECCTGLAIYISGSEQEFVKLMNKKASDLGMNDTHFTNTTGLQDENHYTTVEDLAKLLGYALKNDVFRKIFTTPRYSTSTTNKHPGGITFYSTMFKSMQDAGNAGRGILGGKTGYTAEAGLCLASLARIDGKEYILVTAGAKGNHKTEQYNISDAYFVYSKLDSTNNSF